MANEWTVSTLFLQLIWCGSETETASETSAEI